MIRSEHNNIHSTRIVVPSTPRHGLPKRCVDDNTMKEVLYEVRCLKSTEDMILALAGQFKQLLGYSRVRVFFLLWSNLTTNLTIA